MSENTDTQKNEKKATDPRDAISRDAAEQQVKLLFDAFDVDRIIDPDDPETEKFFPSLAKSAMRGRLEIGGDVDDVTIMQHFREPIGGRTSRSLQWNWRKLGMAKSRIGMTEKKGVELYNHGYKIAAPMLGIEVDQIHGLHPVDLSLVEVVASFFLKI